MLKIFIESQLIKPGEEAEEEKRSLATDFWRATKVQKRSTGRNISSRTFTGKLCYSHGSSFPSLCPIEPKGRKTTFVSNANYSRQSVISSQLWPLLVGVRRVASILLLAAAAALSDDGGFKIGRRHTRVAKGESLALYKNLPLTTTQNRSSQMRKSFTIWKSNVDTKLSCSAACGDTYRRSHTHSSPAISH